MDTSTEKLLLDNNFFPIGIDEVGRGSLAGPVVACAVVFQREFFSSLPAWASDVNDSKILNPKKREDLAVLIRNSCFAFSFGMASSTIIDDINIHTATLIAMTSAAQELQEQAPKLRGVSFLLIDGKFTLPAWDGGQEAVVRGDAKRFSIAAASILAKVYRDELMSRLHAKFPVYKFDRNKGYGTADHLKALAKFGLSPQHRRTFCSRFDQTDSLQ